ncbi:latrophilin Cirl-like isoform X2 [Argiope bruennichi]|uniref:latrophilin Cirl-like isoform X2 n=1 Tax=Argiope bruennichi TaxID=94029 RepID=UPI002494FD6D|nr:latrophilin Cirl-like isoform X2 [Argiope bruennichi]
MRMYSCKIFALFCIFLLAEVVHISSKKGVLFRRISLKPPLILDAAGYRTTYACEGKTLHIVCDEGMIHLIRANYGRFSISICNDHGNLDWRVNCMSHHSFLIMQERCSLKTNCSVNVSSSTFHDPCPGTLKYLEVQYHCGTGPPVLTMPVTTPYYRATYSSNVTAVPIGKIQTGTYRSYLSTPMPTIPTIPFFRTTAALPKQFVPTTATPNRNDGFPFFITTRKTTEFSPTIHSLTSAIPTSTTLTTTANVSEDHCPSMISRSINWPWTKSGQTASVKCPDGATGNAKWHCKGKPAHWNSEFPDLTECRSLWLENLKERLQNGDSIIGIISELAVMSSAKALFSEDIKILSELTQQALHKSISSMENFLDTWHRYHVLRELLQSALQTFNGLLDDKQDIAWKDIPLFEKKMILSKLLQKLDESALLLAESSSEDGSFSLIKSNIWISLQVIKSRNAKIFTFPIYEDIFLEADGIYWVNVQDKVVIPIEAIEDYAKNGFYKVVFSIFNKLDDYLLPGSTILHYPLDHTSENITRILNSRIISISLEKGGNVKLSRPAVITFKHRYEENVSNPVCAFWDFHLRDWSAKGCRVEISNKSHTVCLCDHLTNFALIMDLQTDFTPSLNSDILYMIITIGCVVATVALLFTVIVLFLLSVDLSEDSTFIHRNMFLCLLLSELVFLGGIKQTNHHLACSFIAGILQYLFLVTFSWMFFECYHQYVTLIQSCDGKKSKSWWYYVVAYTVPGIITGISAIIDPSSYGTSRYCWLQADNYFVFSFVGPAVSIIFGGLVFLCISLCMIYRKISNITAIKGKENVNLDKFRSWNKRSFLLTVLLTLTWTSAFFFIQEELAPLAYAFSILNGLHGIAILFMYCFQNEKVREDIQKIFQHDLCFRQRNQEPQIAPETVNNGNNSRDCDSQEFWTLPKEKIPVTSNVASDSSATLPTRSSINESNDGVRLQNAFWMMRGNNTWKSAYYTGKETLGEQEGVSHSFRRYQTSKDKGHHFFVTPESNGQFLDHIYETIDDEALADEDGGKKSFQGCQRFPPPENYYGDHSDLSQHSSSSYGYDQQPLIIAGLQNGQNVSQVPYPASPDSQVSPQIWEQNQTLSFRKKRSPSEKPASLRTSHDGSHHNFPSDKQAYPQKGPAELWETPLPDLLQSPPDNTVVLAVLDGDKVVNRIQQDDVIIKPQYKLSTYC